MEYSILKLINRPFLALQNLGGCHSEFLFNFDSKLAASPTEISCFRQCSGDLAIGELSKEVLASLENPGEECSAVDLAARKSCSMYVSELFSFDWQVFVTTKFMFQAVQSRLGDRGRSQEKRVQCSRDSIGEVLLKSREEAKTKDATEIAVHEVSYEVETGSRLRVIMHG